MIEFFKRTVEMPEGWSHTIYYHGMPDGIYAVVHQTRPHGDDFWSMERHPIDFTNFKPNSDVEISSDEFLKMASEASVTRIKPPTFELRNLISG